MLFLAKPFVARGVFGYFRNNKKHFKCFVRAILNIVMNIISLTVSPRLDLLHLLF